MWGDGGTEDSTADPGVTPVVGIALLIGLLLVTAVLVFAVGHGLLSDLQDQADEEQATAAMRELAHDLAHGGQSTTAFPSGGMTRVDSAAGWKRVAVGDETIVDETDGPLGAFYYETDDVTIAYQGGGVWRQDRGQVSTMVQAPPIQYGAGDEPTLALSVQTLAAADRQTGGDTFATVETRRAFPDESGALGNPITENVTVTVHSEFYRAWGEYYAELTGTEVEYDHDAQQVTVTLRGGDLEETDSGGDEGDDAIRGLFVNEGGDLTMSQGALVDSYDSSDGRYAPGRAGEEGDVLVDGAFHPANDAEIHGDVNATSGGDLSNTIEITGDVLLGDAPTQTRVSNGAEVGGLLSIEGDGDVPWGVVGDDLLVGGELETLGGTVGGDLHVHEGQTTVGDGSADAEIDGSVYAGDDLRITNAVVEGDVYAHGDVRVTSRATIRGDVTATGTVDADAGAVEGSTASGADPATVPTPRDPIVPEIPIPEPDVDVDAIGDEFADEHDNDETDAIEYDAASGSYRLDDCGDTGLDDGCELTAGQYYLDEIDLHEEHNQNGLNWPEELTLDTTDGPVEIYVDGDVLVEDPAGVEVVYDEDEHAATIYTDGDLRVKRGATIEIEDDRTPVFEVFGQGDVELRVEGGSTFRGALYGLEEGGVRPTIDLSGGDGTEFYGAMLGNVGNLDQEAEFHYDVSLLDGRHSENGDDAEVRVDWESADVVYLHLEERRVEAS